MRSPLFLPLAAALVLRVAAVSAEGARAVEAPAPMPRVAPANTALSAPAAGLSLGAAPNLSLPNVPSGTGSQAQVGAANAAAIVPAPSAAAASAANVGAIAAAVEPGAPLNPGLARQAGPSAALQGAAAQIKRGQSPGAQDPSAMTDDALKRIFDAAAARRGGPEAGAGAGVAGKQQQVQSRIMQTARIADSASAHDAPALYKDAVRQAEQAALSGLLSSDVARSVAETVVRVALRKVARALPELADGAYNAAVRGPAGKAEVEKAFKSFEAWDRFIGGGPSHPLVANLDALKTDVRRVLEAASRPDARKGAAPRAAFSRDGDQFTADLSHRPAANHVQRLPEDVIIGLALKTQGLDAPLSAAAALTETPGVLEGARLLYRSHRRTGRSAPGSAAAAMRFSMRAAARSVWERLAAALSALAGRLIPGRVDLGGQTLTSYERGLSRLAALGRPASEAERALAGRVPSGVLVASLDLARLNRRVLAADRALSRASKAADGREALLTLVSEQAADYQILSADASAAAAVAGLRLDAPVDAPGGLAYWLGRVSQASLDLIDRRMLGVLDRQGLAALAYGDLSALPGGMMRLVSRRGSAAVALELQGLGFETELGRGGLLRAWSEGPDLERRLEAALDRVAGAAAGPAPGPDAQRLARAVADMTARPAASRQEAQRLQALDPAFSGFEAAGVVESRGVSWLAERGERRSSDGKTVRYYLLRDLDTREALFGHAETLRSLPAR